MPKRNLNNYDWCNVTHPMAQIDEVIERIKRSGWEHEDGFILGMCGDKQFAKFIIENLDEGIVLSCIHSSKIDILQDITNQEFEDGAEWKKWWDENKNYSQLKWIQTGFQKQGISIQKKLSHDAIVQLLKLIGRIKLSADNSSLHYLIVNAKRLLAKQHFNAIEFLNENYEKSVIDKELLVGLLAYNYSFWDFIIKFPILTDEERATIKEYKEKNKNWYYSNDAYVASLLIPILISCLGTYLFFNIHKPKIT